MDAGGGGEAGLCAQPGLVASTENPIKQPIIAGLLVTLISPLK